MALECPNCSGKVERSIGNPDAVGDEGISYECSNDCGATLKRCDNCSNLTDGFLATTIKTSRTNPRDPNDGAETIITCADCDPQDYRSFGEDDVIREETIE